jgi:hypothetical protein
MRAGSDWSRTSLVVLLAAALLGACGGKTEASCEQPADAAGCGGSSSPYGFEVPAAAQQVCDVLFAEYDGCGRNSMEVCLMQWATDDSCDQEEEALLDCLLHGDGYRCNYGVLLQTVGACQELAEAQNDCQEGRE